MRKGHGTIRSGRWWFYFDSDHMTVGRAADANSVIYSLFGLVAEHYREEGHAERAAAHAMENARRKLVKRWQGVLDTMWRYSEWNVRQEPGETAQSWLQRRWHYTVVRYEGRAATARACGEEAPEVFELRDYRLPDYTMPPVQAVTDGEYTWPPRAAGWPTNGSDPDPSSGPHLRPVH